MSLRLRVAAGLLVTGLSVTAARADSLEEQAAFKAQVRGLVAGKNFAGLDDLDGQLASAGQRFSDGAQKHERFNREVAAMISRKDAQGCRKGGTEFGREWLKVRPHSARAILAVADGLIADAWCARGEGAADTVSPEGARVFAAKLREAQLWLNERKKDAVGNSRWYSDVLTTSLGLGSSAEDFNGIAREGLRTYPLDEEIIDVVLHYYRPQWYGSHAEFERVAQQIADANRHLDGGRTYALAYWRVFAANPFRMTQETSIDWGRMRSSMRSIVQDFPDRLNYESFARISCFNQDWEGLVYFTRHLPAVEPSHWWSPWRSPTEREACMKVRVTAAQP